MILPYFPKNCMKLKAFGPPGGVPRAPLRSATEDTQPDEMPTHDGPYILLDFPTTTWNRKNILVYGDGVQETPHKLINSYKQQKRPQCAEHL